MIPGPGAFSSFHRSKPDLLILGGGINGAAILREASSRGYSCLLAEKYDFASGASGHSSHLIHGGLRYLEFFELDLVRESLKAREWVIRAFPDLCRPINLTIPFTPFTNRPPWMLKTGLFLYDLIAGSDYFPKFNSVTVREMESRFPGLDTTGFTGGLSYSDGFCEWPERLVFSMIRDSSQPAFNYVSSTGSKSDGILLKDQLTGEEILVNPGLIINATGAWNDQTAGDFGLQTRLMGGTSGSHLVFRSALPIPEGGLYTESPLDHRPVFLLPWNNRILFGTTDLPFRGDPGSVQVTPPEIDYLEQSLFKLMPALKNEKPDFSFCAVRPLPFTKHGSTPGKISRKHTFVPDKKNKKIIHLVGGKLTVFPVVGQQATGILDKLSGKNTRPSGWAFNESVFRETEKTCIKTLPIDSELISFYGQDIFHTSGITEPVLNGVDRALAEIKFVREREQARTWPDVFERRTCLAQKIGNQPEVWNRIRAGLEQTGASSDESGKPVSDYLQDLNRNRFLVN
ncbi:MAG: glycerol-3-phosphate dehydrogenase/oxidase [Bacteroidetes bacterium]|nr:glycerol-3-phosphate dehydrogenase/oxidase [Bacteroidota bacterium]